MGIINIIKNAKKIHKDYIILIKVGNFYNCYGRDAYIISYLFDYNIRILEDNIYVSSFPKSAYNKVISKIEENKINYIILDKRNNYDIDDKSNYGNLNKYYEMYEKAKEKIKYKMRVKKIYQYLLFYKDEELVFKIERGISERRKVQSN